MYKQFEKVTCTQCGLRSWRWSFNCLVQLGALFFAAIQWFLNNHDRFLKSHHVFVLGQVCDCGHPSWSESEDALQPRASTIKEPADPSCPYGFCYQVHGLLQRELLEEKGYE